MYGNAAQSSSAIKSPIISPLSTPQVSDRWVDKETAISPTTFFTRLRRAVLPAPNDNATLSSLAKGFVDRIEIGDDRLRVTGWALAADGRPAVGLSLLVDGHPAVDTTLIRTPRSDVRTASGETTLSCGFSFTVALSGAPFTSLPWTERIAVLVGPGRVKQRQRLPLARELACVPMRTQKSNRQPEQGDGFAVPDQPAMPGECVLALRTALKRAGCYLEYGSGGSTLEATRTGVATIISVESDHAWLEAVNARTTASLGNSTAYHPLHVDIGPTERWGHPRSTDAWQSFPRYAAAPWLFCSEHQLRPDLVLVDGRFRVACLLASVLAAEPGCVILFDDYTDRKHYQSVESILMPVRRHGRMAEFVVPAGNLDRGRAIAALLSAAADPR